MSLDEVFDYLNSILPQELVERGNKLRQDLECLKEKVKGGDRSVTNTELLNGIRQKFELEGSSDFLSDADWLMNALSFTNTPIDRDNIPLAWESYQLAQEGFVGFYCDDYPILEAIADWFFAHREDTGRDEAEMVARCLAVYESLVQKVWGKQENVGYEDILAGNGQTIVFLYFGVGDFERAKFFTQVLELEHLAGRLDEEDYDQMLRVYHQILEKEHRRVPSTADREYRKITNDFIRVLSDTYTDDERKIEKLEKERTTLDALARAKERLKAKFGVIWSLLDEKTRNHLELGETWTQPPLRDQFPWEVPTNFYLALKAELL